MTKLRRRFAVYFVCYDTVHYRIGAPNEKNLYNEERKKNKNSTEM